MPAGITNVSVQPGQPQRDIKEDMKSRTQSLSRTMIRRPLAGLILGALITMSGAAAAVEQTPSVPATQISGANVGAGSGVQPPAAVLEELKGALSPGTDGGGVTPQGSGCPELRGPAGTSAEIYYTFIWINNGCPIPIRKGIYGGTGSGFGWEHLRYRTNVDRQINHETTSAARSLWGQALSSSGSAQSNGTFCHFKQYKTPGGTKRTMKVIVSSTNYEGQWGLKGIITAFWVSGWTDPCRGS